MATVSLVEAPLAWRWVCASPRCGNTWLRNGQRKQIIRTHLLSETSSDYIGLVPVTGLEPVHPHGYGILSLCRHLERRGYLSTHLEPRAPKNPAKSMISAVDTAQSTAAKRKTQRGRIYKISASWRDIRRDMNQPAHAIDTRY